MSSIEYQPWLGDIIERYRAFFADDSPGSILVKLSTWDVPLDYASVGFEGRELDSWSFPDDAEAFAEHCLRRLRAERELVRSVEDDRIPSINPGLGIALNSVYYSGAEMIRGRDTTWAMPAVGGRGDIEALRPDPDNPWFGLIGRMNRRFCELNDGDYAVQTFSHLGPMDFANALRGNDLFTDFYDAPEMVHTLMERCVEAVLWLEREQRRIVPEVRGGTVIWGTWSPGRSVFMSEDASDLCSPATFTEFGRPYTERISEAAGGCWIHHHAKGLHVHGEIARVKGLRALEISLDPNCERPIDRLPELYESTGGVPLVTRCEPRDVYERIDEMRQGRLILELKTGDMKEAREAVGFVRKHSRI